MDLVQGICRKKGQEILTTVRESRISVIVRGYAGRRMPKAFMREESVEGGRPSLDAAPLAPATFQCESSRARTRLAFSSCRKSSFV